MMALSFLFGKQIVSVFGKDPEVMEVAARTLKFHALAFPCISYVTMANMMMQSSGKTTSATLLSSARSGLFLIPALLILPKVFGLLGLQMSQPVADACSFILSIPLTLTFLNEMEAQEQ